MTPTDQELDVAYRRLACVHEAGHAVMNMHLGFDMHELRVTALGAYFEDKDVYGYCSAYSRPGPRRSVDACVDIAGVLACALYCRNVLDFERYTNWKHCYDDWNTFQEIRGGMTYRQARRITLHVLRRNRQVLLDLADVLERDGFVNASNALSAQVFGAGWFVREVRKAA